MPLSRPDFERILQVGTVDTGNGTLFGFHDKRAVSKQRLMLIISSGGSGKSAIQEAMKTARQKLSHDFSNYVKFIVIDSASDELEPLAELGIDTLNISSPGAIERLAPSSRSSEYKKFVPRDYPYHELNDQGAGQKRMHGKVKLYDRNGQGSTNDSTLVNKIRGLFSHEWNAYKALPLDIMILSGVSGGNGSGTFLNIAALVRAACPAGTNITVYGYLMMPDTAEKFAKEDSKRQKLYANGFAALKELESYMSIRLEQDRKEMLERQNGEGNIEIGKANPVFDYPVLLSGDYGDAVSMIAETIVNAAAESGGNFTQRSFYANIGAVRGTKLSMTEVSDNGILKPNACPEDSHSYCSIGYAYASIPEKIVIPNIVGKVSHKLYEADPNAVVTGKTASAFVDSSSGLTITQFEDAMRTLLGMRENAPITEKSLWEKINNFLKNRCKPAENNVDITYDDVAEGHTAPYFQGFRVEERANDGIHKLTDDINNAYTALITQAKIVMQQYGPRAIEYLYTGNDLSGDLDTLQKLRGISLKTQLQTVLSKFNEEAQMPGRYPGLMDPVRPWDIVGQLGKKARLQEWEGSAVNAATRDIRHRIAQRMGGERGDWHNTFSSKCVEFVERCKRFADVLETLADFYKGRGLSLDAVNFSEFANDGGGKNGINLCSDARMYDWVQNQVAVKVQQIAPDEVREAFVNDFFSNMDDWISEKEGKARTRFDDVMSSVCRLGSHAMENSGISLTITDYFNETLEGVLPDQQRLQIENTIDNIMTRLRSKSAPSLKARNVGQANIAILVPPSLISGTTGTVIEQAFLSRISDGDQFAESTAVDSIVCYQTAVAIALADLEDLTKWENAYCSEYDGQTHLSDGEYIDLHMTRGYSQFKELTKKETDRQRRYDSTTEVTDEENQLCGTGLSWKHYPSINVERYYQILNANPSSPDTRDTFEGQYWRIFSQKVDQAIKYGIIECREEENNVFKYFINLIPSDWTNLDVSGYDNMMGGRFVRGEKLFDFLRKQNVNSHAIPTRQIALSESPFFGPQGFNLGEVQRLEGWDKSLIDRVQLGYMKRMLRKMTGLYQDLEDTLYRYIEIEKELWAREVDFVKFYDAKQFAEWILSGVINVKDIAWTILTNANGGNLPLITFDRMTVNIRMKALEKALTMDGQKLPVVYLRYRSLLEGGKISQEGLEKVKENLIEKIDPMEYETMLTKRLELLSDAVKKYYEKIGSAVDPVRQMMDQYKIDNKDVEMADMLVKFFQALEEVISEQQSI